MRRALHGAHVVAVIVVGIGLGKLCQYAAVGALAERIGFDLASLAGVAPFVAMLLWVKHRHPAMLAYRRSPERG